MCVQGRERKQERAEGKIQLWYGLDDNFDRSWTDLWGKNGLSELCPLVPLLLPQLALDGVALCGRGNPWSSCQLFQKPRKQLLPWRVIWPWWIHPTHLFSLSLTLTTLHLLAKYIPFSAFLVFPYLTVILHSTSHALTKHIIYLLCFLFVVPLPLLAYSFTRVKISVYGWQVYTKCLELCLALVNTQ